MTVTPTWDPAQYLRHAGHRTRPSTELLARIPEPAADAPRIADLGCGAGNVTALLAERWPAARITGYDNSPEMLEAARAGHAGPTPGGGHLDFVHADLRTWTPEEPYDLIISSATLQWVPGHADRFADWVAALNPGGTFAFQIPGNFDAPSHALMREIAHRHGIGHVLRHSDAVLAPQDYLARLTAAGCTADVWETTYIHLLTGEDPVLDWVKGTGLRPVLTALADEPERREAFLEEYRAALRTAYPPGLHGTAFPFRRLFAVAHKPAKDAPSPAGGAPAMITALDHVQLAAPAGSEDLLRDYYGGILGMREIPKPPALAARGGCWFQSGPVQLHLGIENGFRPARKAHPGIRVSGIRQYADRLDRHGAPVTWDDNLPGHLRFFTADPVGNRLEFLEPVREDA
ncbi:hypothetical protein GCM10009535_55470 [Streptomyces thermocarboxydovorans]|uniref:Trans-aconitate 2-methyltransferase n=1 Tax=Streptomyces thermocarboxydovorans TaxID=59298 RepID=A0ABP3T0W5_9ACTN